MTRQIRKSWRNALMLVAACGAAAGTLTAAAPASAARTSPARGGAARSASNFSAAIAGLWPARRPARGGLASSAVKGALDGVFCVSASDCWAVGSARPKAIITDQILHWTGQKWSRVAAPAPGGNDSELRAVRCLTAVNCWAVGSYSKKGVLFDQILHWTGKRWSQVDAPTPGGTLLGDINQLNDVSCVSARNCWAVGSYGNDIEKGNRESTLAFNQALHWDGMKWSLIKTPQPGGMARNDGSALNGVRCASPRDCWAAGTYGHLRRVTTGTLKSEMLHWNGLAWAKVTVPSPGGTANGSFTQLNALSCTSATNCWATGEAGRFGTMTLRFLNLALHWNGKKWLKVGTPNPAGVKAGSLNSLTGVTCLTDRDCWAVGILQALNQHAFELIQILHWNGVAWSQVKAPHPAGAAKDDSQSLNSVRCVTSTNCWAVGLAQQQTSTSRDAIVHWNGKRWSVS